MSCRAGGAHAGGSGRHELGTLPAWRRPLQQLAISCLACHTHEGGAEDVAVNVLGQLLHSRADHFVCQRHRLRGQLVALDPDPAAAGQDLHLPPICELIQLNAVIQAGCSTVRQEAETAGACGPCERGAPGDAMLQSNQVAASPTQSGAGRYA